MSEPNEGARHSYNPWTIVHLVFDHLAEHGLQPTLGEGGDPGGHAAQLLRALGVEPSPRDQKQASERLQHLAELRAVFFEES